jgi:DNA-binding transcriptional LysR family regulator
MKLPPLKSLVVFETVGRHLHFKHAADERCITNAAVSQSIRNLETYLGFQLFNRNPKGVAFTPKGQGYHKDISAALNAISLSTVKHQSHPEQLKVNFMGSLALQWFIPQLENFRAAAPEIQLVMSSLGYDANPLSGEFDLAVTYGEPGDWPGCVAHKLFDDELFPVCSPGFAQGKALSSLDQSTRIEVTAALRKDDWANWADAAGVTLKAHQKTIQLSSSVQATEAAKAGLGVAMAHAPFVKSALKSKQLVRLSKKSYHPTQAYYFVCPKTRFEDKQVQVFYGWLFQETRRHPRA